MLDELAIIAALAVTVTVVLARLQLPTVAGLLAAGAIAGPFGLGLVHSVHSIEMLAEVGVVLLLFTIGLEFSLSRLRHILKQVALGGFLQVASTAGLVTGLAIAWGQPIGPSIYELTTVRERAQNDRRAREREDEAVADHGVKALTEHVVIVGYGVAGRLTSQALAACGVPYVVLELNAETVRHAKARGVPVYYGDATSEEALGHAHIATARGLVLLMNDPQAVNRVVDTVRRVAPHVPIIVRARYLADRSALVALGANDIVAEEVEGAVEIISRLLRAVEVPRNVIDARIHEARMETQSSDRTVTVPRAALSDHRGLKELKIESVSLDASSAAVGASAISLALRASTGALVVAVRRGESLLEQPDPSAPFQAGDIVYLVGTTSAISHATSKLA